MILWVNSLGTGESLEAPRTAKETPAPVEDDQIPDTVEIAPLAPLQLWPGVVRVGG